MEEQRMAKAYPEPPERSRDDDSAISAGDDGDPTRIPSLEYRLAVRESVRADLQAEKEERDLDLANREHGRKAAIEEYQKSMKEKIAQLQKRETALQHHLSESFGPDLDEQQVRSFLDGQRSQQMQDEFGDVLSKLGISLNPPKMSLHHTTDSSTVGEEKQRSKRRWWFGRGHRLQQSYDPVIARDNDSEFGAETRDEISSYLHIAVTSDFEAGMLTCDELDNRALPHDPCGPACNLSTTLKAWQAIPQSTKLAISKWMSARYRSVQFQWTLHAALSVTGDIGRARRNLQKLVVGSIIHVRQTCVLLVLRDSSHVRPIQLPQEQINSMHFDPRPPKAFPVPPDMPVAPFKPTHRPSRGRDHQPDHAMPPQRGAAHYRGETPNVAPTARHGATPTSSSQRMKPKDETSTARVLDWPVRTRNDTMSSERIEDIIREHPPMVDHQRSRERRLRNFAQGTDQDDLWSNDDPTPEEEMNSPAPGRYTGPSRRLQTRVTDYSEPAARSAPVVSHSGGGTALRRRSHSRSRPLSDNLVASKDTADRAPRRRKDLTPPSPLPSSSRDRYEQRGFDPRLSPIYERSSPSARQSEDRYLTSDPQIDAKARVGRSATPYQDPYAGTTTQEFNTPDLMPDDASDMLEDTLDDDALKRKMLVKYAGTTVGHTLPTPQDDRTGRSFEHSSANDGTLREPVENEASLPGVQRLFIATLEDRNEAGDAGNAEPPARSPSSLPSSNSATTFQSADITNVIGHKVGSARSNDAPKSRRSSGQRDDSSPSFDAMASFNAMDLTNLDTPAVRPWW